MKISATLLSFAMMLSVSVMAQKSPTSGVPGETVPGELIVMFHKNADADYG